MSEKGFIGSLAAWILRIALLCLTLGAVWELLMR